MYKQIYISETDYKILYVPNNKYVDKDQDLYLEWLAEGNEPEIVPYVPQEHAPPPEPSIAYLIAKRTDQVNKKTHALINAGFKHKGVNFHCDDVAQQNFTALYAVREQLEYPYTVWDGEGTTTIDTAEEMAAFYLMGIAFVHQHRFEGKQLRDQFATMTTEQLKNWSDPRDN